MIKLISLLLLTTQGFSMKPAPFDTNTDINTKRSSSDLYIESKRDTDQKQGYSTKGTTTVYEKKALWSSDIFIGRRRYELSVDGRYLLLFGSVYYSNSTSVKGTFVEIYKSGKLVKTINLEDIVGGVNAYAKKNDIGIKGGGWISSNKLMQTMFIDWKRKTLEFTPTKGKKKVFEFRKL